METLTAQGDQVAQALRQSRIPVLRRLRVEDTGDVVVISGYVPTYYYKQLAQEAILPLLAGRRLVNRLTVIATGAPTGDGLP